jgi:hypothetical protein
MFSLNPPSADRQAQILKFYDKKDIKTLQNSWAQAFYNDVFTQIDESRFSCLYSEDTASRPNFPVNILLGLEILSQYFSWSDKEAIAHYKFDNQVRYALGEGTVCRGLDERTLQNFRRRLLEYEAANPDIDLILEQFLDQVQKFKADGVDTKLQRCDTTFFMSNIRYTTRLSLAYDILVQVIRAIPEAKQTDEIKAALEGGFKGSVTFHVKPTEKDGKLANLLRLINVSRILLKELYNTSNVIRGKVLRKKAKKALKFADRFLEEQAIINEDGSIVTKAAKDIPSGSLQSAYDWNAAFRKKGNEQVKGFVVNLSETASEENETQIITYYDVAPANCADTTLIKTDMPSIINTGAETMVMDGGFYGIDVVSEAEELGLEVQFTNMTGSSASEEKVPITAFEYDEETHEIFKCPMAKAPVSCSVYDNRVRAVFEKGTCDGCELKDLCLVKQLQNGTASITLKHSSIVAAETRQEIKLNGYALTSKRAAIEGTNSALKRKCGLGKLRVRGIEKCNYKVGLIVMAHNFFVVFNGSKCSQKGSKDA